MFQVTRSATFMDGFDPLSPLNRITAEAAEASGTLLGGIIDLWVRKALAQVVSPETLQFFVETRKPIPGIDLYMMLRSPHSRTLEVRFKEKSIAKIRIDTQIKIIDGHYVVAHVEVPLTV